MKIFNVKNKAGRSMAYAAESAERACEIAAKIGHILKKENGTATDQTDWWQEHRPDDLAAKTTEGPMVMRVAMTSIASVLGGTKVGSL